MKSSIFFIFIMSMMVMLSFSTRAQTSLAPNQNPNYMLSQNKYTGISDSLTSFQSTTSQETYKAIDFLEDKKEARSLRKAFRRERARSRWNNNYWGYNNWGYNNWGNYNAPFINPYNNFYNYHPYNFGSPFLWNRMQFAPSLGIWLR